MTLLIVDDEYYSAESTRRKIEQNTDCFEEIHCAYSMAQALDYFASHPVSVMICDIEMPGGSGLQLLDHIRESGLDTICIYLTAFAKFEYISTAMKLSSIDYLLKPVDQEQLLAAVSKAVQLYEERNSVRLSSEQAVYWQESQQSLYELFWMDLAAGIIGTKPEEIVTELKRRNLNVDLVDEEYLLLLVQYNAKESLDNSLSLFEFTLKNICYEYYFQPEEIPVMIRLDHYCYLLPLPAGGRSRSALAAHCRKSFDDYTSHYPHSFNYYIASSTCGMASAPQQLRLLLEKAYRNVSLENHVFDLAESAGALSSDSHTDALGSEEPRWREYLMSRRYEQLRSECDILLNSMQHSGTATRNSLIAFYHGFLHLLLSSMEQSFPAALPAFRARAFSQSEEQVVSSFHSLQDFTARALTLYADCAANARSQDDTVVLVRTYIREHLSEKLSRESLASMVYLTPDYLSHLFKNETGYSLTNYVIHERIEEAKRLLLQTDMNIWDIAISCGFQNISYFSRQFKNFTGITPREFRG
ncbi:MAG: helix-turn-helix domain-containing protein [Eubacteriales bacterium]|nr:helix-turn-helix domain-containing protein [Eubacteriales bacterium]